MRYVLIACCAFFATASFQSCGTTQAFAKAAYINNDAVHIPNEKATDITIVSVSFKDDKEVYEKAAGQIQSFLSGRSINSNMLFFDASENDADVNAKIKEKSGKPYYLVIEKMSTGTKKDEINMDMIYNEINVSLQKSSGERIADLSIGMDRQTSKSKLAKQISDIITSYLSKKHLI